MLRVFEILMFRALLVTSIKTACDTAGHFVPADGHKKASPKAGGNYVHLSY